jgi:hypothetical protein
MDMCEPDTFGLSSKGGASVGLFKKNGRSSEHIARSNQAKGVWLLPTKLDIP